ncbi:MAG: efflux transporter outer membrane subunit [Alphaproteobacteria bacterium]|nr:efflux transporter outer membrane subunit [Alphaproteobacteria bacterium]
MRPRESQGRVLRSGVRRFGAASLAGILALPLGGCFVNWEQVTAALDVPKTYREAPLNHSAALPSVVWWRGFRSKELTDLIEESLTSNFDVAVAVARIVQADAQSRVAGAPLLPAIDLSGSVTRSRASRTTGTSGTVSTGPSERDSYSTSLSASYEIDFWGKNRALMRAAEQNAVATRFDREVVALTTVVTVANSYFQVLAARDQLRIARGNLEAATRVYRLVQERFEAGTASALDTAQQESVVNSQRASIPPLEQAVRQNIATLAVLVGRPPERVAIRGASMDRIAIPPVTPGLPSDLIAQRPDIRDAEARLAGGNANVHAARAAFFPSIRLTGEGGYQSSALQMLFRPESAFFNLAAGLTQPIFDGARIKGEFDFRRGQQDELLQLYRKAVVNGFADVDRALVAVQQTARREALQRDVVASTRRAFEIAETRLREGTVDLITVLTTQLALFQSQDTLAQARLARLQAVVSLFQALGGGWQKAKPEGQPRP